MYCIGKKNAVKWAFHLVCACSFCGYQSLFVFPLEVLGMIQWHNAKKLYKKSSAIHQEIVPSKKKVKTHPDYDEESLDKVYLSLQQSDGTVCNRAARNEHLWSDIFTFTTRQSSNVLFTRRGPQVLSCLAFQKRRNKNRFQNIITKIVK